MTSSTSNLLTTVIPEIRWAQRSSATDPTKNYLTLKLIVPDLLPQDYKLDLSDTGLTFSATPSRLLPSTIAIESPLAPPSCTNNQSASPPTPVHYAVALEFLHKIDPENSTTHHTDRGIELILRKADLAAEYWPRLLKESKKNHFIKTDFDKWVDEDEQDSYPDMDGFNANSGFDFSSMPGMSGMDMSSFGGNDSFPDDEGSDDAADENADDLPDDDPPSLVDDDAASPPANSSTTTSSTPIAA